MISGGETRLEMWGARSLSVENSSESYSSYRKKFDLSFPKFGSNSNRLHDITNSRL